MYNKKNIITIVIFLFNCFIVWLFLFKYITIPILLLSDIIFVFGLLLFLEVKEMNIRFKKWLGH